LEAHASLKLANLKSKAQSHLLWQLGGLSMNGEKHETITLGGGCFWCLEAVFEELKGVRLVTSGYAGGHVPNPTYEAVCRKDTGHAEVVQVSFNPEEISLREILDIFFTIHDPTTPNRQGADVGSQYRSIILYHSPEQKAVAEKVIKGLEEEKVWSAPIVTEMHPLETFYRAEEEHEQYYRRNPNQPYCQIVVEPKVAKLRSKYRDKLRK
jgi:peptide-methionine (S)-S-oxide reductase